MCVCVAEGGKCTEWETVRCSRGWGVWKLEGRRPTQGIISCWKWLSVMWWGNVERWCLRCRERTNFSEDLVFKDRESKSYSKATESCQTVLKQSDRHTFHPCPLHFWKHMLESTSWLDWSGLRKKKKSKRNDSGVNTISDNSNREVRWLAKTYIYK